MKFWMIVILIACSCLWASSSVQLTRLRAAEQLNSQLIETGQLTSLREYAVEP